MECITNNNKEEDVEGRQEYDEERTWSTCCDYGGLGGDGCLRSEL